MQNGETKSFEVTFVRDPEEDRNFRIWGVAEEIIKMGADPSKRKEIQARIKRLVHSEKLSVYSRLLNYTDDKKFLDGILRSKVETHRKLMIASDDEVITWNVE